MHFAHFVGMRPLWAAHDKPSYAVSRKGKKLGVSRRQLKQMDSPIYM